jgi:heme-degrading monooxygenase HmoA
VIVRVFEARLRRGADEEFAEAVRDDIASARRQPGLVSLRWGRRDDEGDTRVIVVSEWVDLEAVRAWLGPSYLQPRYAPGEASLVVEARIRHYEGLER